MFLSSFLFYVTTKKKIVNLLIFGSLVEEIKKKTPLIKRHYRALYLESQRDEMMREMWLTPSALFFGVEAQKEGFTQAFLDCGKGLSHIVGTQTMFAAGLHLPDACLAC